MSEKQAFLFAGQGAQAVGMGRDLLEKHDACKSLFERADSTLGRDISGICFNGPDDALTRTSNCQPAVFLVSAACLEAYRKMAVDSAPVGAGGLSLGEWTALYAAGVISFEDTLRILEARGSFMEEACEETAGGMLSILGLDREKVDQVASQSGLEVANINSPGQIVLSGRKENMEKAAALAGEAGAKRSVPLNVAGAYHSSLMSSAAGKLEEFLSGIEFRSPVFPVVSNVTGAVHGSPEEIRANMVKQVVSSVDWISCVNTLSDLGARGYIEFGPGRVLSGLVKRIDRGAALASVQDCESLEKTLS